MHEMSICESVVATAEQVARRENAARVTRVRLEIGCFGGVELDALRFSFDVVANGTLADGAALEIIELPGRAWCFPCGTAHEMRVRGDPCPTCGGHQLQVVGGEELRIKDLEVV